MTTSTTLICAIMPSLISPFTVSPCTQSSSSWMWLARTFFFRRSTFCSSRSMLPPSSSSTAAADAAAPPWVLRGCFTMGGRRWTPFDIRSPTPSCDQRERYGCVPLLCSAEEDALSWTTSSTRRYKPCARDTNAAFTPGWASVGSASASASASAASSPVATRTHRAWPARSPEATNALDNDGRRQGVCRKMAELIMTACYADRLHWYIALSTLLLFINSSSRMIGGTGSSAKASVL